MKQAQEKGQYLPSIAAFAVSDRNTFLFPTFPLFFKANERQKRYRRFTQTTSEAHRVMLYHLELEM